MRNAIITKKDVLTQETVDSIPTGHNYELNGVQIYGKRQLMDLVILKAEHNIREKYLMREVQDILDKIELVSPSKKDRKKIWKIVKFVE